ncbi:MAG: transcriptional regulator, GntR family [Ilumatobacteraceae bacterium]|nr:transcriptional regulator, GntR family [Ilumatobacteraceae bacterium]
MTPPVVRAGTAERVAFHIRRAIFRGELLPGTRVPQTEIAEALGISRIPVREALIGLEREGWVTIELHRGAFVRAIDADAVRDHYELFGLAYGLAARRAIERSSGEALGRELVRMARSLPKGDDPAAFTAATRAFHGVVVRAARSDRTEVVLQALSTLVPGDFFTLVPAAIPTERRGLKAIAAAVAAGSTTLAAEEYVTMMEQIGEKVVDVFAGRGLIDRPSAGRGNG